MADFQEINFEGKEEHTERVLAYFKHQIANALTVPLIESNDEFRDGMTKEQQFFLRRIKLIRQKLEALGIEFDRLTF